MNNKLYIGNLPYTVTDADLSSIFGQLGQVTSARVITDRDSGRSKGFGFVEMATPELAQSAIQQYNGADLGGRAITVSEAKPQEPRPPRSGGFGAGRGGERNFGGGDRGGRRGGERGGRF